MGLIKSLFAGPIITIGIWAIFLSGNSNNTSKGTLGKVLDGLTNMSSDDLITACLWGIPAAGVIILMGYMLHSYKRVVVNMRFDNDLKELTIITRRIINDKTDITTIDYTNLRLKSKKKLYDGMSMGIYEGIEFHNRSKYVGDLFKDHFTWNQKDISAIEFELTKIGKAPNLF